MNEYIRFCFILLLNLLAGFDSGTGSNYKHVCEGDYLQLFQNISIAEGNTVNLYIEQLRVTMIGTWHSIENHNALEEYKEKVSLDVYGTIWIRNIQISDEGKYSLQKNTEINRSEVQIDVRVAPTKYCKPNISRTDNLLIASLDEKECGRPQATVLWLVHPESSRMTTWIIKLPPENQAGTYHACAETPALRCVQTLQISDYCANFTIEGKAPCQRTGDRFEENKDNCRPLSSEQFATRTIDIVILSLILFVLIMMTKDQIMLLRQWKKKRTEGRALPLQERIEGTDLGIEGAVMRLLEILERRDLPSPEILERRDLPSPEILECRDLPSQDKKEESELLLLGGETAKASSGN